MARLDTHPYATFLDRVIKPTRYTGAEHGARHGDWNAVDARVCLAFPDVYDIGMSHLGFKILYQLLNDAPANARRARLHAVGRHGGGAARARRCRWCRWRAAARCRDFDVVGFSLQFELTFTNILTMLDLGGIPLRTERARRRRPARGRRRARSPPTPSRWRRSSTPSLIGDGEEATTRDLR